MRRLLLLSLSLPFTLAPFSFRRSSMYKMWKVFDATATAQMCIRDVQNVWARAWVVSIDNFSRIRNLPKFSIDCQYSIERKSRCNCFEYCGKKFNRQAHSSVSLPSSNFTIQNEGMLRVDILLSLELGASTWIFFSWSKMFRSRNNGRRFARFTSNRLIQVDDTSPIRKNIHLLEYGNGEGNLSFTQEIHVSLCMTVESRVAHTISDFQFFYLEIWTRSPTFIILLINHVTFDIKWNCVKFENGWMMKMRVRHQSKAGLRIIHEKKNADPSRPEYILGHLANETVWVCEYLRRFVKKHWIDTIISAKKFTKNLKQWNLFEIFIFLCFDRFSPLEIRWRLSIPSGFFTQHFW